jgi:hypothetical protein
MYIQPKIKDIEQIKYENPPPKLNITQEQLDAIRKEIEEDNKNPPKKPIRKFNWPWAKKSILNKAKAPEIITVLLINSKKQLVVTSTKVYTGNFFVINNRVYEFEPSKVLTMDKWKVVVARDYDRKCVGVDDYQELLLKDFTSNNPGSRININDPVIIKAIIQAHLAEKQSIAGSKWIWIIGAIILAVIIGFFFISSKKGPVVATVK